MPTEYQISSNIDLIIHLYNSSSPPPSPNEHTDSNDYGSSSPSDIIKYYVTAWSLQQASPIFSRIISPSPHFKQPSKIVYLGVECKSITLEDDCPHALSIVLNLLHLNTKSLPSINEISWNTFYDIAIIWDKYDISNLIAPPWLKYFQKVMNGVGYEGWLFIGKTFGEGEGYVELTARLIVEAGQNLSGKEAIEAGPGGVGFTRGGRYIDASGWPDSVREHITSENSNLMEKLRTILTTWKWSFKGKRPRALCTCYGNVPRYNRHTSLSNSIADLLSDESMTLSPQSHRAGNSNTSARVRLASRLRDIEGVANWQWNGSIVTLRRRMGIFRSCMGDRDMRQVKHMLENADIYDLCPLEESALRVLYDFDQTIETIRGIGIDGKIIDVPLNRLIEDAKTDPWNSKGDGKKWDSIAMLGVRISGIFALLSVVVFAIALGKGWGVKMVESGIVT
ncbi:hypothetical protein AOL_s00097g32 [Orbilia oligospora ATCC 24927]|uniref:BTB domain-containing protein n=2 Tax=Orbilia oligospora TaxID=2813651 RepID=G1XI55_ARTOA|nr:hypothetical protein AOL_s00097g32 [Orbilia oligospora ATCC 24927]EGX47193.1 hypothetical protein AOL_s00097g32 [Orbilia oligospora ATCC 24927]KAF3277896.1 hypothetical protein TWF970_004777 [Orbilia oligospora]